MKKLNKYFDECLAVIVSASEDFGIVAVEAQSHGKPVVAFRAGGALETIVENKTGWFFDSPTAQSLQNKIVEVETKIEKCDTSACIENSKRYSKKRFQEDFSKTVNKILSQN